MEFTIGLESPFNLDYTLESGQVFRWQNRGEWWYGVVSGGVLKVRQEGDSLTCISSSDLLDSTFVRNYFRLDVGLENVLASIMRDETITLAVQTFYGLRLIRQERWECLASFVLATNSNIPRIRKMIQAVCARFGEPLQFEGIEYHAFPKPGVLSEAPLPDLKACGLGYRAPFLKHVAASVEEGRVDFSELSLLDYEEARKTLVKGLLGEKLLPGVGPKVADCVLLYSYDKDEAFPIDVWIARQIIRSYPKLLDPGLRMKLAPERRAKIGRGDYERISSKVRSYFGPYAGYAQQYLFMMARSAGF
ncbi:MAG: DNA glycosylase [Nitrososphaerales archaeon]|jgi:N-glycosylase/DNA lyase